MPDVTDLLVRFRGDASGAVKSAAEAGNAVKAFGALAVVGGLAVAGMSIAVGIATTKMAGDFQSSMTALVTGAGEVEGNLGLVSSSILKMAVDTGTSTSQLAAGMFMIESAGFHGAAGLDVLKASAEGAKVGQADLGVTADAVTTILKDYPNIVNGASGAVNGLISTVASGKTHMQDLATALAQVLPTASAAGVGIFDVEAAMATMTAEGVPAANAATYLRQAIIALEAPGKEAKDTLASIGLTTNDVSAAMKESLPDALKLITDHLKTKFPEGSAAYIAAIKDIAGGSKQMQAFLDLTGIHMDEFGQNLLKISGNAVNGGKSISGWALVQQDFNQKIDRAKEVVETLGIKIGTFLLPIAGHLADLFSSTLPNAVQTVTGWFNQAGDAVKYVQTHMDQMRPVVAGAAAVIGVVLVAAFLALASAAWAAAAGVLAATWPVIAIAAGIGLLVAAVVWAYQNWGWFKVAVDAARDALGWVKDRIGDLLGFMGNLIGHLVELRNNLMDRLHPAIANVSSKLSELHSWFQDKVIPVLKQLYSYFKANILPVLEQAGQWVKEKLQDKLSDMWAFIQKYILPILGQLADMVKNGVGHDFQVWGDTLGKLFGTIGTLLGQLGKLKDTLSSIHPPNLNLGGLHIPGFASGTDDAPGGLAIVHKDEMVILPQHSKVIPALQTAALMRGDDSGSSSGGSGSGGGGYRTAQINVYLDGRQLARGIAQPLVDEIHLNTGVRR